MGQSSSTAVIGNSPELLRREIILQPPPIVDEGFLEDIAMDRDYTVDVPDECLAYIFQFLGSGDRKRCSVVCKRWLRVDGQNRHRLSLNAQSEILADIPSLFARFDSVTKLALRCDRKSSSINDDALILISLRCVNIMRLKLRGCRDLTDIGVAAFAQNCKGLKKLSIGTCTFGAKGINAVLDNCTTLEELSVKRLRSVVYDGAELIGPGVAASSLKSICLKELVNGQAFEPLIIGAKNLKTLKLFRCLGDWDKILELVGKQKNPNLIEIHLERLQVSDTGLSAISNCSNLEILHIVKTPECTNLGLVSVAEHCKLLRKLHIDGWRTNRIGDEGLVAIAKHCPNLQELVLIGINATHLSFEAIASKCQKLERLALCGSDTIGDAEFACIAAKCVALRKLCIKHCAISDLGIGALAWGCPNLVKVKVRKCTGVSSEVAEWLRERRGSLVLNLDSVEAETLDASGSEGGEAGLELQPNVDGVPSGSNGRLALLRTKLGLFAGRNLAACTFRRWTNSDNSFSGNL